MENITVTIEGEGLSLTKKTTLQKAGQIISFLGLGEAQGTSGNESPATSAALLPARQIQPKEAVQASDAKTYPEKIAALALYLRDERQQDEFSPQEIKLTLKKLGDEPKNFGRDLRAAVDLQYVACIDEASERYVLTDAGAEAVKGKFSQPATRRAASPKRAAATQGVRDEVKNLPGNAEGLVDAPNFHKLPTKGDKILWAIAFADKNGIESLTPAEVEHLTTKLRGKIVSRSFTALNERNLKNGYTTHTAAGHQIQQRGLDYLRSLNEPAA